MDLTKYIYQEKIVSGQLSKTIFRLIFFTLNWWRTIPCQIAFLCSSKKELVKSDFGSYSNIVKTLIFAKHNRNLFYHRMGRNSIFYSWILQGDRSLKIPYSCALGKHAMFVHNDSCHLNAKSIGDNFVCYPHVIIGSRHLLSKNKPTIGNNVIVGSGAVIVGDIIIGDNVKIGANTCVTRNIPANSTVHSSVIIENLQI